MSDRIYYSIREAKKKNISTLDLETLKEIILKIYSNFQERCYFQENLGIQLLTLDNKPKVDIQNYIFIKTRKNNLWPIKSRIRKYTEHDLFDIIEILYHFVSKPENNLNLGDCPYVTRFNISKGKNEFRREINNILCDYKEGFELLESGEISKKMEKGLEELLDRATPEFDPKNIDPKIKRAIHKFRDFRSSKEDCKDAIQELADILEYLKKSCGTKLPRKEESDLFNISNNFGIRHHEPKQKTEYDQIWLDWMFHIFLASIYLSIDLNKRNKE